jgi:predicted dehydrogenase
MGKLKVGVMGLAWIGDQHARSWAAMDDVELVAVADLAPDLRAQAVERYNPPQVFEDYREMLAGCDADIISICLPTPMHAQAVTECLRDGRHVLCEKPPTSTVAEAEALADVAAETGRTLGFALQRRFESGVMAARDAIASGQIGDAFYARCGWVRTLPANKQGRTGWRLIRGEGGGSLLDIGVHLLDATWYAMGCPAPVSATGYLASRFIPVLASAVDNPYPDDPADDICSALLRFENGAAIQLESAYGLWRLNSPEVYSDITGVNGGIQVYPKELIVRDGNDPEPLRESAEEKETERVRMCTEFANAVRGRCEFRTKPGDAITIMGMLEAIMASHDRGCEVAIRG